MSAGPFLRTDDPVDRADEPRLPGSPAATRAGVGHANHDLATVVDAWLGPGQAGRLEGRRALCDGPAGSRARRGQRGRGRRAFLDRGDSSASWVSVKPGRVIPASSQSLGRSRFSESDSRTATSAVLRSLFASFPRRPAEGGPFCPVLVVGCDGPLSTPSGEVPHDMPLVARVAGSLVDHAGDVQPACRPRGRPSRRTAASDYRPSVTVVGR